MQRKIVHPPKKACTKGDVTIAGPRISVGEQLDTLLVELRALKAVVDKLMEDGDTEEYSSGSDAEDDATEEA